jgi:predicted alpha/beta superfamily hydrolase
VREVGWERYPGAGSTVVGDVRILRDVESPQLANRRDLLAYLPPSHGNGRHFPVLYMHDGQNLFDDATANDGEWQVDETMEQLAREGIEAVVVGVPSAGALRPYEYGAGGADAYLAFLVETVRPLVGDAFDVDATREATGIGGSSFGGVISFHALAAHPDVFGFAALMSPTFWWNGERDFEWAEQLDPTARVYLDVGDEEFPELDGVPQAYVRSFERMEALLRRRGFDEERLLAVLDRGGLHHETAWARRLPDALRFLLPR